MDEVVNEPAEAGGGAWDEADVEPRGIVNVLEIEGVVVDEEA